MCLHTCTAVARLTLALAKLSCQICMPSCFETRCKGFSRWFTLFPGVSLTVPEGAVSKGCTEVVFVVVLRDDKDRPKLSGQFSVFLPTTFMIR